MRGDSGVAGEGRVPGIPNFHSWGKYIHYAINKYQLGLDVQRFLWPVCYIILYYAGPLSCILGCNHSKTGTPLGIT